MKREFTAPLSVIATVLILNACTGPTSLTANNVLMEKVQPLITAQYRIEKGKQIVTLKINDQGPYLFVFDTGAEGMFVSSTFRDLLNLPVTGTDIASSPAGGQPFEVQLVNLSTVDFDGAITQNVEASIVDLVPDGIVGVIGPSVFKEYGRFAIEFATHTIYIGGRANAWPDITWLPFGGNAPLLDVNLQIGDLTVPTHIDSGAPQSLALPEKYADKLALTGPAKVVATARMVDRELEIKEAPIDLTFEIGDARIVLNRVMLFDVPYANIGLEGLSDLFLEIDWLNDRFALRGTTVQPPR